MKYYSTNGNAPIADLHKAVVKGLAEDRGLYMPEKIKQLPKDFFDKIDQMSFQEIAYTVEEENYDSWLSCGRNWWRNYLLCAGR